MYISVLLLLYIIHDVAEHVNKPAKVLDHVLNLRD